MKTELKMRVSFYPRNKKELKQECPIMLRISLNGDRMSLGQTGLSVRSDMMTGNRVNDAYPDHQVINAELEKLECRIFLLAEQLLEKNCLSLETLRDALNGRNPSVVMMSELFNVEEQEMADKLASGMVTVGTCRRHKCARQNFEDFLSFKYKRKDIRVSDVSQAMIFDYEEYLGSYVGYDRNTVVKYLGLLGKPIRYAYRKKMIERNPFEGIKLPRKNTDRGYLTDEEVAALAQAELKLQRLEVVRDAFLFSCFTGLSYIDVRNLTEDDIHEINGQKFILIKRQKTTTRCDIPLFRSAEEIIDKYKEKRCEGGRLLPLFSNQKTNKYLKEIAEICKIKKHLTFHLARHTFATMALSKGVSIETISRVLGHSRIQTTQIYARITTNKIAEEMSLLEKRLINEHYANI